MANQNGLISEAIYKGWIEGASPFQNLFFPLSFKGEGDKGGKVDNTLFN